MIRTVTLLTLFLFTTLGFSQTLNKQITYNDNKLMLVGKVDKNGLTKAPYSEWFNKNHDSYLVNEKITKAIKDSLKNYTIKAFLGTWCGDSKKEVPRFYSVLEAAKYPMHQMEVFALDRSDEAYKQGPNGEEKGMDVHRVPTFIFYKDGKEISRIVEHPKETFERDIQKIVTGERYIFNYTAANYIQNALKKKTIAELREEEATIVPLLAEYTKGSRELNTLGYVFLRSEQLEKAHYVFDLNTKIFPYKHNVFDSLAEYYFETKNYTKALANYYKVLSFKPEDENALKMVEDITKLNKQNKLATN